MSDDTKTADETSAEPVHPEVQAQLDRETRERKAVRDAEDEAQRVLAEREALEAEEILTEKNRTLIATNQRIAPTDQAVFLAATGHNE